MLKGKVYSGIENLKAMRYATNYNNYLLSIICRNISDKQKILDFGAGLGTFAIPLYEKGYNIHSVELDPKMRSNLKKHNINVYTSTQEISSGSFDVIYAFDVLEHIQGDAAVLQEWYRILKPDGKIIIYVPAFQMLYSAMDQLVGHVRRYNRKTLKKLAEKNFTIEQLRYIDSVGFCAVLISKLLKRQSGQLTPSIVKTFDHFIFPISLKLDFFFKHLFGKNLLLIASKK